MKITDILIEPKYLRSEIEACESLQKELKILLPESPVLSRLQATIAKDEKRIMDIEAWLESVPDAFIKDVIQTFRSTGDWSKTNVKIYGYPSYHTCRKAVVRYLERTDFLERFG